MNATTLRTANWVFLPYLTTGLFWFYEENILTTTYHYLEQRQPARQGSSGLMRSDYDQNTERGAAWVMRTLAHTCAILSNSETTAYKASFVNIWEQNIDWYYGACITGTATSSFGGVLNNLGLIPVYSAGRNSHVTNATNRWWAVAWMHGYFVGAIGYAWDLGVPQSAASQTKHQAVRDHCYKLPVGLNGDGSGYCYRRYVLDRFPVGTPSVGYPTAYLDFATVYSAYLNENPNAAPNPLTLLNCASGQSVKERNTDTDLTSVMSGNLRDGYWGYVVPAIAYAAEHGATGAVTAYARMTGASNYTPSLWDDTPQWGVVPRS